MSDPTGDRVMVAGSVGLAAQRQASAGTRRSVKGQGRTLGARAPLHAIVRRPLSQMAGSDSRKSGARGASDGTVRRMMTEPRWNGSPGSTLRATVVAERQASAGARDGVKGKRRTLGARAPLHALVRARGRAYHQGGPTVNTIVGSCRLSRIRGERAAFVDVPARCAAPQPPHRPSPAREMQAVG